MAGEPVSSIVAERIVHCGPSWTTTFAARKAVQTVDDTCVKPGTYSRELEMGEPVWSALEVELLRARFEELPGRIEQTPGPDGTIAVKTDDDLLCLTVRRGRDEHRVCGAATDILLTNEGRRFSKIWVQLLAVAPEPVHW